MLGNRVAKVYLQVVHPRLAHVLPVCVCQGDRHLMLLECLPDHAGNRIGAENQESVFSRLSNLQQPGNGPSSQALQSNGGNNQHEHHRHKGGSAFVTEILELESEECRNRRRYNTPGSNPA